MPLPGQGRRDHGTPTSTAVPTAALLWLGPSQAEPRVVGTVTDDHCGHPSLRSGSGPLLQSGPFRYPGGEDPGPPLQAYVLAGARPGGLRPARLCLGAGDSRQGCAAFADAHRFANPHAFANCQRKTETKHDREVVAEGVAQLDSATAWHAARR